MTELRQRMLDAMQVRGLSARTQECYVEAVARMARHYHRSPDLLSPAQVEAYMLHLVKDRKLSYSSVNHAASASRFLFEKVLGRNTEAALRPPMAKVPQKQPELLAREQIAYLFACCAHPVHRMALQTIYATGLRISEACALKVSDIDSAADRMCVRVVAGKGAADRYSILSTTLLPHLHPTTQSGPMAVCQQVFNVRANNHGGKRKERLSGSEFVRRFLLHVLHSGVKRIRHYGVLASSCKGVKLPAAREALHMPQVRTQAVESASQFMARVAKIDVDVCPCCRQGRLHRVAVLATPRHLPTPHASFTPGLAQQRGPP